MKEIEGMALRMEVPKKAAEVLVPHNALLYGKTTC
jgi:hypothetical protein